MTDRTRTAISVRAAALPEAARRRTGARTTRWSVNQQIHGRRLRCMSRRKRSATGDELSENALRASGLFLSAQGGPHVSQQRRTVAARAVLRCFAATFASVAADLVLA